ncbi:MAG: MBL fold metallo-hydrolase [Chitinophagaceae bacterium]|nr:MAG: MBL fold metallo-hydrolase [Chitinophagaceae bacterium]
MITAESFKLAPGYFEVAPGVWGMKDKFVNFYMVQDAASGDWVLIDAGLKISRSKILRMAQDLFGDQRPAAILLTHGHFDHVGALEALAEHWNVPVYAHYLEFPYLSGISSYPPADPTVGGGMMSVMSVFYPNDPIDISSRLIALPEDGAVPFLEGWQYIHTPGHAPGHVSFFRKEDKVLIAGDAFVTTKQESLICTITQKQHISGPPMYFTCDWEAAEESVNTLTALEPAIVATGHGKPFSGPEMEKQLRQLNDNFYQEAVPAHGRYANDPAVTDASGVLYVPPKNKANTESWMFVAGIILAGVTAFGIVKFATTGKKGR